MDSSSQKSLKQYIFTIPVFAFFLFAMLFRLNFSDLWQDEWNEYNFSRVPLQYIYLNVITTFQPPLYNYLMHFWLLVSDKVEWFRLAGVVFGFLGGIMLYKSGKLMYSGKAAAISIAVLACCYQWVYCIQECAEYNLMLACLCGALYFYLYALKGFTYNRALAFLLFSVAAIYSQYGSVFIVIPLLLFFYFFIQSDKKRSAEEKIIITILYIMAFFLAAVPLFKYFLLIQMGNNEIGTNRLAFNAGMLKEILLTPGAILGWLFNMDRGDKWPILKYIFSLLLIAGSVFVFIRKVPLWEKSIVVIYWIAYLAHYLLVQLHIYAMVHPKVNPFVKTKILNF